MNDPKKQKKKSRKRKYIILFSILAVIIAGGTAVVISQRNNIDAARYFLSYSPDELRDKIDENEQRILDAVEEHIPVRVPDLTDEEKELLASDELSMEDAVELLVERAISDDSSINGSQFASALPQDNLQDNDSSDEVLPAVDQDHAHLETVDLTMDPIVNPTADTIEAEESVSYDDTTANIVELIAEVYVLRAHFTNQLEQMRRAAIDEFLSLGEGQQSESTRMDIGMKYLNLARELEAECDRLMDDLVARLRRELEITGGDTSLVNDIIHGYAEEKSLRKAYYLSLYS
jgi:hypothetical protein